MSALSELLSSTLAARALDLVLKVSMLLALGLLVGAVLRSASAAFRHFVWTLVLVGSAALVVLSSAVPSISLRLSVLPSQIEAGTAGMAAGSIDEGKGRSGIQAGTPADAVRPMDESGDLRSSGAAAAGRRSVIVAAGRRSLASGALGPSRWTASGIAAFLAALWILGTLLVLARLVLGHIAVARLMVMATPLSDAAYASALRRAAALMHVGRRVRLLISADVTAPITARVFQPVIFLPPDAATWTDERVGIVLMHELAHIARLDYLAQVIASATCALFWFHPGIWFAARRLRAEAEQATDDRVLNAGAVSVTYATHLLEIARHGLAAHRSAAVTLGMAWGGASHFERRLRAMLDTTRSRSGVTSRQKVTAGGFALLALIPLAGVRTELVAAPVSQGDRLVVVGASGPLARRLPPAATAEPRVGLAKTTEITVLSPRLTPPDDGAQSDSTFEKTLRASVGERIRLDLESGGTVTLHAWDEPNVRMQAKLSGASWRDTRVTFERVNGGLRLEATQERDRRERSTSHRFELWVPRQFDVDLRSSGGGITIMDVEGDFAGHTGGGSIEIEHAKGSSSLSTGGGNIRVTDSELRGTVSTGGGTVLLSNVRGGLRASSGSGPVIYTDADGSGENREASLSRRSSRSVRSTGSLEGLSVAADRIRVNDDAGPLHISKAGGRISLERAPRGGTLYTGGGDIRVGGSAGLLSVQTGGGRIELKNVAGDAEATTGAGDVTITIVNADGSEHSIAVHSGKGHVVLQLPQTLSARFDLETAYTEGFGRRTSIESDFRIDQEETQNWDDSQGTPRKYVRAHGTFGNGGGLIRVRTVNGDITVRRASR